MPTITVTGKTDLGFSQTFGMIEKGKEYQVDADNCPAELFDIPKAAKTKDQPAAETTTDIDKGGA